MMMMMKKISLSSLSLFVLLLQSPPTTTAYGQSGEDGESSHRPTDEELADEKARSSKN
jgi:hypothetical protein